MKSTSVTKATPGQARPPGPDPVEGSREVIEAELRRQGKAQAAGSAKKARNKRKIDKSH